MKLQNLLIAIPLILGIIVFSAWTIITSSNNDPLLFPAKKIYVNYGYFNRADAVALIIVNERNTSVYPGNPIQTVWKITNTDDKLSWTGEITLILDKADKLFTTYFKFQNITQTITLGPKETIEIPLLGYLDPEVTLTNSQMDVSNKSVQISLAVYEKSKFNDLFWNTRSLYYHQKFYDRNKKDYTQEHYDTVIQKCNELINDNKYPYLPWICNNVGVKKTDAHQESKPEDGAHVGPYNLNGFTFGGF